jgi:hypothetical protein
MMKNWWFAILPVVAGWWIGGWEWAAMGALALAVPLLSPKPAGGNPLVFAAGGMAWLFAFWISGDRRLFFPYSMQYAVQAACLLGALPARAGAGVALITAFLAIRMLQEASRQVLLFELLVAVAILAFSLQVYSSAAPPQRWKTIAVGAAASMLAFASLGL